MLQCWISHETTRAKSAAARLIAASILAVPRVLEGTNPSHVRDIKAQSELPGQRACGMAPRKSRSRPLRVPDVTREPAWDEVPATSGWRM